MSWKITQVAKVNMKDPILIEGLPGMGNVGKIAVDFLIEVLGAKKLFEITSYQLPHCVFVNEDNMVELPEIEVYYKNVGAHTLLFLAGDIQPMNEESCYEFCHAVLDTIQKKQVREIITLGGIALPKAPESPRVFCTGNSKKLLKRYEKSKLVNMNTHTVVGPIIGVSGLLTGLAGKRNIPAVSLLAETFAHPNYLGVDGAKELLKVLRNQLGLKINVDKLDDEFTNMVQPGADDRVVGQPKKLVKAKKLESIKEERQDYFG
ncbi:MAG: PAC2 family protein [Nanoarchaeota archaeon]|nr:PAC2 family protein [Nanoarchaeota archaeon]